MHSDSPALWIFNPDTDYALASNRCYYTPPASVIKLRRQMALTFLPLATPGVDAILLLDNISDRELTQFPEYREAITKGIEIVNLTQFISAPEKWQAYTPRPWGWNKSLHTLLSDSIGTMMDMPTDADLYNIRRLSHRRTSIEMLKALHAVIDHEISIPVETCDIDEVVRRFNLNREIYIKAPWSSSGRGIVYAGDLELKHVEPWARGIIRKQGSVIIETAYPRKLDFASEWYINQGVTYFSGFSVFKVSNRGKYHGNIIGSQNEISKIIESHSNWHPELIDAQKSAIQSLIAPYYSGPLGIDMLATESGAINPCVEINLRYTMGHIAIYQSVNRFPDNHTL